MLEQDALPLTNPEVEIVQAEEGKPLIFKATVQVRPEVTLGDYKQFNFSPEIDTIDEARVSQVLDELRDQNATLAAVEDRGARDGDYAVISFIGTRDGVPFEGGTSERMPLILGQERLIPGFEANLLGLEVGGATEFDITFPDDYPETSMAGAAAHFEVQLRELREKVLPELDADFIGTLGDFADLDELRADIRRRLERSALDRARHGFADRIIDYAVANATVDLPDILVDQEVEVMHDEFRATLVRQGISEEAYLAAVDKTEADMHAEFRPGAEKRVRTLLVLSKVAEVEGVTVSDAEVEAEVAAWPSAVRGQGRPARLLRLGARPVVHPEHPPPEPCRRGPHRRVAGRPPGPHRAPAHGRRAGLRRRRGAGRRERRDRGDGPRLHP